MRAAVRRRIGSSGYLGVIVLPEAEGLQVDDQEGDDDEAGVKEAATSEQIAPLLVLVGHIQGHLGRG